MHTHRYLVIDPAVSAGSAFGAAEPRGRRDAPRPALLGGAAPGRGGGQQHPLGAARGTAPGMYGQGGMHPGKPMKNLWKTQENPGKPMENLWKSHGKPMERDGTGLDFMEIEAEV